MNAHQEEIRKVIDPLKQKEAGRIRIEKSKYEEQERFDSILWKEIKCVFRQLWKQRPFVAHELAFESIVYANSALCDRLQVCICFLESPAEYLHGISDQA